jgi:glucose-6-phosphate isomerase
MNMSAGTSRPHCDHTAAWALLRAHFDRQGRALDLRDAFRADPRRFECFSQEAPHVFADLSKNLIDLHTESLLLELARECGLEHHRDAMFAGAPINNTEQRPVKHWLLRTPDDGTTDDSDALEVHATLHAMLAYAEQMRGDAAITDVVNIGIGGSDLGPQMAVTALAAFALPGKRFHFVSNIDGHELAGVLGQLRPESTLFLVASKTFTTIETMTNAKAARKWIADALGEKAVGKHFAAVSTALDKVDAFGIPADRIFGFWDWVGGRYSIWSAIGLPLMIAIGPENFGRFLDGAHAMDEHFRKTPLKKNLPMMLGLVGYWHRAISGYTSRAVIPYDQRLARLPAYLQQLDMESNGKGVTIDGKPVTGPTGPVVWGEPGTNGQHAFFQLLHQGTDTIPVEFIVAAKGHEPHLDNQHEMLLANCLAQSEALMRGRTLDEAKAQLAAKNLPKSEVNRIAPHRVFTGNRPSITIIHDILDPYTLGRLIALYEHRVFVEAQLYGINAFDQWGVELGKELATELLPVVSGEVKPKDKDASTQGLVAHLRKRRGK